MIDDTQLGPMRRMVVAVVLVSTSFASRAPLSPVLSRRAAVSGAAAALCHPLAARAVSPVDNAAVGAGGDASGPARTIPTSAAAGALEAFAQAIAEEKQVAVAFGCLAAIAVIGELGEEEAPERLPEREILLSWSELALRVAEVQSGATLLVPRRRLGKICCDGGPAETPVFSDARLRATFNAIDTDGSGTINADELGNALRAIEGVTLEASTIETMLALGDASPDAGHELPFEEFQSIMRGGQPVSS